MHDTRGFVQNAHSMSKTSPCPICRRSVSLPPENTVFPFCTERCRTVDLGKWFDEEYRLPVEGDEEDDALPVRVEAPAPSEKDP